MKSKLYICQNKIFSFVYVVMNDKKTCLFGIDIFKMIWIFSAPNLIGFSQFGKMYGMEWLKASYCDV